MCSDMSKLRAALKLIIDEEKKLDRRLDDAISVVSGMGKAVVTSILTISYPDKYGVWNNTSEGGLKEVGLWPRFERGMSFGKRYVKINQSLVQLAQALNTDLWTLDVL